MNRDGLISNLKQEEGFKPFVYDDANGKLIAAGYKVIGNPTIGYGWCLSTEPVLEDLAEYILGYFVDETWKSLISAAPWIETVPEDVQTALADMAYNLGVNGLLKFTTFLEMIKHGNYSGAADDLQTSRWAKQVKTRAARIEGLIRNAK